jgi:hypothetical protein
LIPLIDGTMQKPSELLRFVALNWPWDAYFREKRPADDENMICSYFWDFSPSQPVYKVEQSRLSSQCFEQPASRGRAPCSLEGA